MKTYGQSCHCACQEGHRGSTGTSALILILMTQTATLPLGEQAHGTH